jgi:hypothetical protein
MVEYKLLEGDGNVTTFNTLGTLIGFIINHQEVESTQHWDVLKSEGIATVSVKTEIKEILEYVL